MSAIGIGDLDIAVDADAEPGTQRVGLVRIEPGEVAVEWWRSPARETRSGVQTSPSLLAPMFKTLLARRYRRRLAPCDCAFSRICPRLVIKSADAPSAMCQRRPACPITSMGFV